MAASPSTRRRRVTFELRAEPGSKVFVAGTFNGWNPDRKQMDYQDGAYKAVLLVSKGRHEYKFIIDDIWCVDPECPDWVPNDQGSLNSVLFVD